MRFLFAVLLVFQLIQSKAKAQFSQNIFYQENCHCIVLGDGGFNVYKSELISLNTPVPVSNMVVKNVILTGAIGRIQSGYTSDSVLLGYSLEFNGTEIPIALSNFTSESIRILTNNPMDSSQVLYGRYFTLDVTQLFNPINSIQYLKPPFTNSSLLSQTPTVEYFFLNVIYENPTLPLTNIVLVSKNRHVAPIDKFILTGKINPINTNKKMVLAVNASDICNGAPDTSYVFVNGQRCGELSSPESQVECSGVSGNFSFFSDSLIAYDNDTADSLFKEADGVANIQPYLSNSTDLDIQFQYWSFYSSTSSSGWYTNPMHQIVVAYTTSCEEFAVTTPEPQAVCKNEPLQLNVTGGNKYEWLPQRGLSCYDCPNPIVSTDSARFYTVRVWNNDTCSVVRPVHISVNDLPKFNGLTLTPTQCADSTGKIVAVKHPSVSETPLWSINGGAFQSGTPSTKTYENLPEGSYTITLKDDNGCTRDTSLNVGFTIPTKASFVVNPEEGASPLEVSVNNTSQNHTNSEWFLQGSYIDTSLSQLFLDTSGLYTLQLITWYKDPKCADTSERTIYVYEDFVVSVPNVFSPNQDGVNEQFGVSINQPATVDFKILNRWGQVIHAQENVKANAGFLPLWAGNDMAEGVYFYQIIVTPTKATEPQELSGFFHLER